MPEIDFSEWNKFLEKYPEAHLLQLAEWGELKRGFGWDVARVVVGDLGAQILFRKLPLGFSVGYLAKPVFSGQQSALSFSPTVHKLICQLATRSPPAQG